jgi:hypothetical protein
VTVVFEVFCTVAPNCCVAPEATVGLEGETVTTIGAVTETTVLDFAVLSATLVAVTVKVVLLEIVGAVNKPVLEIVPAVADQVTVVFEVFCTVAPNCCVAPEATVGLEGETVTTIGGGGFFTGALAMVMANICAIVSPLASVSLILKVLVPALVGVPEITPVVGLRVNPAGSAPSPTASLNGVATPLAETLPE